MEDPISNSTSNTNQQDLFHGYPCPFRGNYEEPEANLSYPYPTSPLRWGFCEREDLGFTCLPGVKAYEEKEDEEEGLQSNGYGDWLSSCWEEDNHGGSYKIGEEDHEPCSEHLQNLPGSENDDPWPWVQGGDYGYQSAEPRVGSEEGVVGLCEGIFGHWPCLLREYHKTYGQR